MITFHVGIAFFDCVIFALTMYKTIKLSREGMAMPVLDLLRRDGVVYFCRLFDSVYDLLLTFPKSS